MSKASEKLRRLGLISPFSVIHAKRMGVSQRMLTYYVKNENLIRVAHGIYKTPGSYKSSFEFLLQQACLSIPQGVVGLKTALHLHGIWKDEVKEIDMIVPTSNVPKRKLSAVRLYRVNSDIYRIDTTFLREDEIPITKLERTLVDLLRSGTPLSFVFAISKKIQQMNLKLDFAQMKKLSEIFRVKAKMNLLLEILPEKRIRIP